MALDEVLKDRAGPQGACDSAAIAESRRIVRWLESPAARGAIKYVGEALSRHIRKEGTR